jgi:NAD(P)-dependent dehydrogenase (short-subunit alcohol dehydrogenase family)
MPRKLGDSVVAITSASSGTGLATAHASARGGANVVLAVRRPASLEQAVQRCEALGGQIPWKAEVCKRAATVHLGGPLNEISAGEAAVWRGEHPERPFVLLAQQSLFDETRAPEGKHAVWAYCQVPNGSTST